LIYKIAFCICISFFVVSVRLYIFFLIFVYSISITKIDWHLIQLIKLSSSWKCKSLPAYQPKLKNTIQYWSLLPSRIFKESPALSLPSPFHHLPSLPPSTPKAFFLFISSFWGVMHFACLCSQRSAGSANNLRRSKRWLMWIHGRRCFLLSLLSGESSEGPRAASQPAAAAAFSYVCFPLFLQSIGHKLPGNQIMHSPSRQRSRAKEPRTWEKSSSGRRAELHFWPRMQPEQKNAHSLKIRKVPC